MLKRIQFCMIQHLSFSYIKNKNITSSFRPTPSSALMRAAVLMRGPPVYRGPLSIEGLLSYTEDLLGPPSRRPAYKGPPLYVGLSVCECLLQTEGLHSIEGLLPLKLTSFYVCICICI